MAKNDFMHNTINVFRDKLDNALKGDNASAEILRAVQELLSEINAKYPQTAFQPDTMVNTRKNSGNIAANNTETANIPDGVQFLLNNIAARKQD